MVVLFIIMDYAIYLELDYNHWNAGIAIITGKD